MKAVYLAGPGLLETGDIQQPQPGPVEVLIRVRTAGITTTELGWYPTLHTKEGASRKNAVPAHEFSGVVEAVGPNVSRFQTGDEVFGMNDWFADGALAEYCVAGVDGVILKPPDLEHTSAAAIPIGALTAWQGLYTRAELRSGDRLLIHGGAGAVGTFAVQLARLRGAYVIATAAAADRSFVEELGANEVIDYRATPFESIAREMDVVFDAIGGETLARSWSTLKPNGRLVTIASGAESSPEARVKNAFFIVEPDTDQLAEVARMVVSGELRAVIDVIVPWSRTADAYAGRFPGQGRGKIVIDCLRYDYRGLHDSAPVDEQSAACRRSGDQGDREIRLQRGVGPANNRHRGTKGQRRRVEPRGVRQFRNPATRASLAPRGSLSEATLLCTAFSGLHDSRGTIAIEDGLYNG